MNNALVPVVGKLGGALEVSALFSGPRGKLAVPSPDHDHEKECGDV